MKVETWRRPYRGPLVAARDRSGPARQSLRAVEPHSGTNDAADDVENIEHFCSGYMIGVEMDEAWSQTFEAMEPVFPIADPELNRTGFHGDRFT